MKTKLHIAIDQYEFIELEGEDLTKEQVKNLLREFHNLGDKVREEVNQSKVEKINKHKLDTVYDLEE